MLCLATRWLGNGLYGMGVHGAGVERTAGIHTQGEVYCAWEGVWVETLRAGQDFRLVVQGYSMLLSFRLSGLIKWIGWSCCIAVGKNL